MTSSPAAKPMTPEPSSATTPARSLPGCPDLDQNLTGTRNRAGHVAHLEDVDAAVRIELHCFSHERISSIRLVDQVTLHSECSTLFGRPIKLGRQSVGRPCRDPSEYKKLQLAMLLSREALQPQLCESVGRPW